MSLTLTGEKVKIFKKEKEWSGGKFNTYSMSVGSKDREGNWVNGFLDCAFKKGVDVNNKAVINIKNAFPVVRDSNGKKYTSWFISEFEVVENGEEPAKPVSLDDDDFMNIPDDLDEVPFQ